MRAKKHRRLVEHIRNDPFIDIAFIYPLISKDVWLHVLERQAVVFTSIGDMGESTATYRRYKSEVKSLVISMFRNIYKKTIENQLKEELVEVKSKRAWKALITLLASQLLMKRIGSGLGELLPREYASLSDLAPVIKIMIEEKTRSRGIASTTAVGRALSRLKISDRKLYDIAPLLWWINLVMESEVFEGVFKFHYIVYSKGQKIKSFAEEIEKTLQVFKDHKSEYDYTEYELFKALLSRCAELRGQYINKLQNAILFVKYLRRSIRDPGRWEWFVYNEILTYIAPIYMVEIQKLAGFEKVLLNISEIIAPKKGTYGGTASALASLILLSPIFMQYNIEARKEAVVTPADIIVAILRLIDRQHSAGDFVVSVQDVAEEIVEFWKEDDILRRLRVYTRSEIKPDNLYQISSFTISVALLINAGVEGIHISTKIKPILRLPPRMIGYDSLFIRPRRILPVIKRVWEG